MGTNDVHGGVSFDADEESRLILDSLDEFVEQEVDPIRDELGDRLTNPRLRCEPDGSLHPDVADAMAEVRRKSAEAGFYAMNLPEDVGGGDVSNVTWYRAKRRIGREGGFLTDSVLAGPEGPKPLLMQAEGDQVEEYLEPAVRGEESTAFCLTEPGVGSDAPNMRTSAEKEGDEWVLNGEKQWITNGPYADFVQVFARTSPQEESGRYGGITCFLVEDDEFEVGALNNAVGMQGLQAQLVFDDVRLPEDRVLGEVDQAFYTAMDFLGLGRMELGAEAVGRAQFLLDRAEEYARDREAFGRPIGKFQHVSGKIAKGRANVYAADAAGLRCAWELDSGGPAVEETSAFKYFSTNALWEVVDDVVQVHGSTGVSEDAPFMHNLHFARILRIVEGTDEIQLNTIASQRGIL